MEKDKYFFGERCQRSLYILLEKNEVSQEVFCGAAINPLQGLHWTVPKLSTPKQCERWTYLLPLMTWELWLARDIVADNPYTLAKV